MSRSSSPTLWAHTVVLIWSGMPSARAFSMPVTVRSNEPAKPLNRSWTEASAPSRLKATRRTPAAHAWRIRVRVASAVAVGVSETRNPRSWP